MFYNYLRWFHFNETSVQIQLKIIFKKSQRTNYRYHTWVVH